MATLGDREDGAGVCVGLIVFKGMVDPMGRGLEQEIEKKRRSG